MRTLRLAGSGSFLRSRSLDGAWPGCRPRWPDARAHRPECHLPPPNSDPKNNRAPSRSVCTAFRAQKASFLFIYLRVPFCFPPPLCVCEGVGVEVGGCRVERSTSDGSSAKPCAAQAASRCQTTVPADLMAPRMTRLENATVTQQLEQIETESLSHPWKVPLRAPVMQGPGGAKDTHKK